MTFNKIIITRSYNDEIICYIDHGKGNSETHIFTTVNSLAKYLTAKLGWT